MLSRYVSESRHTSKYPGRELLPKPFFPLFDSGDRTPKIIDPSPESLAVL